MIDHDVYTRKSDSSRHAWQTKVGVLAVASSLILDNNNDGRSTQRLVPIKSGTASEAASHPLSGRLVKISIPFLLVTKQFPQLHRARFSKFCLLPPLYRQLPAPFTRTTHDENEIQSICHLLHLPGSNVCVAMTFKNCSPPFLQRPESDHGE